VASVRNRSLRPAETVNDRCTPIVAWRDRFRDPALTALLTLNLLLVFIATPLAAEGMPLAGPVIETMFLVMVAIVGLLSRRSGALAAILLGLAAILASVAVGPSGPPHAAITLHRGGDILALGALTWVVSEAVYAPGRITSRRLQGAAVLYLNAAVIFASAFSLIWNVNPAAFTTPPGATSDLSEWAKMLYFSLTTLTSTGYGDIVPVDMLARSLANFEAAAGQFFFAITVARLVTLEMRDRPQ
jgi:hypothetical protein